MATKELTYEQSVKRLEDIVAKIDNNEINIDDLANTLKEAQSLIRSCHDKLYKVDQEVKKILQNDEQNFAD